VYVSFSMLTHPESAKDCRILLGDAARERVGYAASLHFSQMLAKSQHDTAPVSFPRVRERIRSLFNGPMTLVDCEFRLDWLYPYHSDLEVISIIYQEIRQMLREKTLLAAMMDDRLAGVGGFMEMSRTE